MQHHHTKITLFCIPKITLFCLLHQSKKKDLNEAKKGAETTTVTRMMIKKMIRTPKWKI